MKLSEMKPPTPATLADYSDLASLQERFASAEAEITDLAGRVGMGKHILEYDGPRQKSALARAMAAPLAGGAAVSKAEAEARANPIYARELDVLAAEHLAACQVLALNEACKIRWDTCRSMLGMIRDAGRIV